MLEDMKRKFEEKFGTCEPDTRFSEHRSRGVRNMRKGIPRQAFFAAALDCRFKSLSFLTDAERVELWRELKDEILSLNRGAGVPPPPPTGPSTHSMAMNDPIISQVFGVRDDDRPADSLESKVEVEIGEYRARRVSLEQPPLEFWKTHQGTYPKMAVAARRYLAIPATTASSERLFSSAGNVISDRRSRLLPDRASALILLRENLDILPDP
jgi:hypothetical protein